MAEIKKDIPKLEPFFGQNLRSGAIQRATPLLDTAGLLLKSYEKTGEKALADEAQRLLEKYSEIAGASIL